MNSPTQILNSRLPRISSGAFFVYIGEKVIEIVEDSGTSILNEVKQIYEDEFSEVLKWYNEGKREDRQIKDYLKYVSDNKNNDTAAEVILQIGDKEFGGQKTIEEWKAMTPLLKEQLETF